ncbi:MAG: hypothetical protein CO034_00280 [Parcubacteria group bacterium CG_4_9_14_0_2_um_filter_35_11]|nr:MAG: hypothetical protein CO034_00280 [Parcubacteria group bacterium CG_4_9_14_0_2_um_filter_35_11]
MRFSDLIDEKCFNIWRYNKIYQEPVKSKFRLSLGEGWTKEENFSKLGRKLNLPNFYLKREDLNPLGSFKVRGLAYQISRAWQNRKREFSISSTGNAALAAAALCHKANLKLFIFFHPRPKSKEKREKILKKIKSFNPEKIFLEKEPTKRCQEFSKAKKIYNLTPSSDIYSFEGFKSIGFEIFERILENEKLEDLAIFSFSSSGSSLIGMGESFRFLVAKNFLKKLPRFYPVKIDKIKRGVEIKKLVKESKGKILEILPKETKRAQDFLSCFKIKTSIEGICAFEGFLQVYKVKEIKNAIIILSGKKWDN